jgi:hypothetical protein
MFVAEELLIKRTNRTIFSSDIFRRISAENLILYTKLAATTTTLNYITNMTFETKIAHLKVSPQHSVGSTLFCHSNN